MLQHSMVMLATTNHLGTQSLFLIYQRYLYWPINVLLLESFMKFSCVELKKNLRFILTWFCFSVFFFCSVCDSVGKIGKCSFLK